MEQLVKCLCAPENPARPVQILHHLFPKTEEMQDEFIKDALARGMGGFCVNVDDPENTDGYLSDDTPEAQKKWRALCSFVDLCFRENLSVWIYDERRFPSGAAGKEVLKALPDAQVKGLIMTSAVISGTVGMLAPDERVLKHAAAYPAADGKLLLSEKIEPEITRDALLFRVPDDGREYRMCAVYAGPVRFMTQNGVPYTDLLRADVTDAFLAVTHERYLKYLGTERMARITAFFTDEPGLAVHGCSSVFLESGAVAAWTEQAEAMFGEENAEKYVSLFFDTDQDDAAVRRRYWTINQRLFSENYFGRIAKWCDAHHTLLTGHMYGEETLSMQIGLNAGLFSLMRHMQMPGVDRLYCTDPRDVTAEKTASSCMHLYGRAMTMSENSFHLENHFWDAKADITDENRLNSWYYQAQLGITNAASYFAYDGDKGRRAYEEKSGRVSEFIRRGNHKTDVIVLLPMRAAFEKYKAPSQKYWLVGPCTVAPGQDERMRMLERAYGETLFMLEEEFFDFDLIDEEGFLSLREEDGYLYTPFERFSQLVVFDDGTWDEKTLRKMKEFANAGGKITFVNVDGEHSVYTQFIGQYADRISRAEADEIASCLPGARRLIPAQTQKGIRVRKSEYAGCELYFLHNRTAETKRACLNEGEYRVFDTDGNETHFAGGEIDVPPKEALMVIKTA